MESEDKCALLEKERITSRIRVLDELLAQGFSLEEICVMINTTIEEIEELLKK